MGASGLHKLAYALKSHDPEIPHLHPLLMDRTTFDPHAHLAAASPTSGAVAAALNQAFALALAVEVPGQKRQQRH